jgi:hypothetical protein
MNLRVPDYCIQYMGETCDDLSCVAGNYQGPKQFYGSSVVWDPVEGATYWVLTMGSGSSQGDFSLVVTKVHVPYKNNCNNATLIDPNGDTFEGSTIVATLMRSSNIAVLPRTPRPPGSGSLLQLPVILFL